MIEHMIVDVSDADLINHYYGGPDPELLKPYDVGVYSPAIQALIADDWTIVGFTSEPGKIRGNYYVFCLTREQKEV